MKTKTLNLILYGISIILTLVIHYFLFSKAEMSSTLHVFTGIIILFLILFVFTIVFNKEGGKK